MFKKLLFLCFITTLLVSCTTGGKKLEEVYVFENPDFILEDFDLSAIKLKLIYSNNTESVISVSEEMISAEDLSKLTEPGIHSVTITYKSFEINTFISISDGVGFFVVIINNEEIIDKYYSEGPSLAILPYIELTEGFYLEWYCNGEVFDPETILDSNTIISYVIHKISFTVTFYEDVTVEVLYGEKIEIPETVNPLEWDFDFETLIYEDITIYKKAKEYSVTYYVDETIYAVFNVLENTVFTNLVEDPTLENAFFIGWYLDDVLYTFDKTITTDIILVARFESDPLLEAINFIKDDYKVLLYRNDLEHYTDYPWANYTLKRTNDVLFLSNVIEITDPLQNLKPTLDSTSTGILYVNKTNTDITVLLSQIHSRLLFNYPHVIINKNYKTTVYTSEDPNYSITIPSNGFLFLPMQHDGSLLTSFRDISSDEELVVTNWNETFEVIFRNNLGEIIETRTCTPKQLVTKPTLESMNEFEFVRWDVDTEVIFFNTIITAIYAQNGITEVTIEVINGEGSGTYSVGTEVILKPAGISGYTFSYWSEFGINVSSDKNYKIYVTIDTTIVAMYEKKATLEKLSIGGKTVNYRNSSVEVMIPNTYVDKVEEFRAAWVSPITGCVARFTSETQYKNNITEMLNVLEYFNMNAVIFHIRIYNDALYNSTLNPRSTYMDTSLDMLSWVISECHKRGIEFHAWMNPYRVVSSGGTNLTSIANSIKSKQPNNVGSDVNNLLGNGSGVILNPGIPSVRQFLIDTCMEVVKNYDVDAIHFDDYFYIDNVDDAQTRAKYNTTGLTMQNFRRLQVDLFIQELDNELDKYNKANNKFVQLGISPSGIYKNGNGIVTYDSNNNAISSGSNTNGFAHYDNYLYSDTLKWINEEWIDYIIPQAYWGFTHPSAGFADVMDWWDKAVKYKNVNLYAGLGIYMADGGGNYSWGSNPKELLMQLAYTTKLDNVDGICMFKFEFLRQYYKNSANSYFKTMFDHLRQDNWKTKAIIPNTKGLDSLVLDPVDFDLTVVNNKVNITINNQIQDTRYLILRSEGNSKYTSNEVIATLGYNNFKFSDTLSYSSNYTYTIYAISRTNTTSSPTSKTIKYTK